MWWRYDIVDVFDKRENVSIYLSITLQIDYCKEKNNPTLSIDRASCEPPSSVSGPWEEYFSALVIWLIHWEAMAFNLAILLDSRFHVTFSKRTFSAGFPNILHSKYCLCTAGPCRLGWTMKCVDDANIGRDVLEILCLLDLLRNACNGLRRIDSSGLSTTLVYQRASLLIM